jgi:hypothetical protein
MDHNYPTTSGTLIRTTGAGGLLGRVVRALQGRGAGAGRGGGGIPRAAAGGEGERGAGAADRAPVGRIKGVRLD